MEKKTRRKNLSLSTSTSHSPRSPTRRFTWLDAALKTIAIGLRMILFLYLDHLRSSFLLHLDHGEEAVRVLLVAVASVQPGKQQIKGVAELVAVASPDL